MTASTIDLVVAGLQARLPPRWKASRLSGSRLLVERPYRVGDGSGACLRGTDPDELVRLAWRLG